MLEWTTCYLSCESQGLEQACKQATAWKGHKATEAASQKKEFPENTHTKYIVL